MKKFILIAMTALGLAFGAAASDTNSLFNSNEIFGTVGTRFSVKEKNVTSFTAGGGYFFTKNFGAEANVPVYNTAGKTVQDVSFGAIARVPLFKNIAAYAHGGADYNWQSDLWSYYTGGGAELRFNKKWGFLAGVDYNWSKQNFLNVRQNGFTPTASLRFVF